MTEIDDRLPIAQILHLRRDDLCAQHCASVYAAGPAQWECDLPRPVQQVDGGVLDKDRRTRRYMPASPFAGELTGVIAALGGPRVAGGESWDQQGQYDRAHYSLALTNLLDSKGNRFALGSPFQLHDFDQITPLKPRSIRLGVEIDF